MSLDEFISTNVSKTAGAITRADIDETIRAIERMPPHPCSIGHHVVSSRALAEGWEWTTCANCTRPVRLR